MACCAYARCIREVDESDWHVEVAIGVMHPDCYELFIKSSPCIWCRKFVDITGRNAISHKGGLYHISCLEEESLAKQSVHVQLALNFGEV